MAPINTNKLNRRRYGFYAPVYDLLASPLERGRRRAHELAAIKPGEDVLIVGAGTGLDLPHLPKGANVTAVDLTPGMLRRASERAASLELNVDCRVMNAHDLDFPDASFDVVLLHLILAVLPDPQACIREASRVLRPDGRMLIFDKFLADGSRPSPVRKVLGIVTDVFFSDINRQLGPLLAHGGLRSVHAEPSSLGGIYTIDVAVKNDPPVKDRTPHGGPA
jgi:ubiquinone/menaquinone biosynthesis C-methylase UbiE